jgi:hypothetical protein
LSESSPRVWGFSQERRLLAHILAGRPSDFLGILPQTPAFSLRSARSRGLSKNNQIYQLHSSYGALPTTARRAKRESGGMGDDPPRSPIWCLDRSFNKLNNSELSWGGYPQSPPGSLRSNAYICKHKSDHQDSGSYEGPSEKRATGSLGVISSTYFVPAMHIIKWSCGELTPYSGRYRSRKAQLSSQRGKKPSRRTDSAETYEGPSKTGGSWPSSSTFVPNERTKRGQVDLPPPRKDRLSFRLEKRASRTDTVRR